MRVSHETIPPVPHSFTLQQVLADPGIASASRVVHGIFEAQAKARPNAVAVLFGEQTITYGELDARANRIARYLRRRGIIRGTSVAMVLPRSIDAYASILGILKAGAAYVPIDPEYPTDRIAWMIGDSGASAVLTSAELDVHSAEIAAENPESIPESDNDARPEDLCYVIYTSGSTGTPKGVMVEHRNISHLVGAEARLFDVTPKDRVYQGASLSFDLSIEEMWLAFQSGATLISATPDMAQAGPDLSGRLSEYGVTVLSCVPTLLSILPEDIPSLRLLILGGERCSHQLVARWSRPGLRIVNTYGPTETTVIATYADLSPEKPVTIGRPVPGYDIYILDDELRPVAPGETGEICIGGSGVARGYIGLPEETRVRFIADPLGETRIFRSGDLGRAGGDGNIEFIGRADGQVKLRGLRIELGEIESALLRADGVRAAACALRENERGDRQLVGYVVPARSEPLDQDRLFSQLRQWLPEWMVPSLVEMIGELPRLPSGKLDRDSLPAPKPRQKATQSAPGQPTTDTEERLWQSWTAMFHPLDVSLEDDFFLDLGGHSLLAAHMVSELRREAGFAGLNVRDVYNYPTISRLACAIDSSAQPAACPPLEQTVDQVDQQAGIRHFMAGAIQTIGLYFVFGFRGTQWVLPYLVYFLLAARHPALESIAWALTSAVALLPALILIAVCAKWSLLGRVRAGRHRLWGQYYLRWWFVRHLIDSLPLDRLGATPLLPFVYRLFGAQIGRDVHIATDLLAAFDVISIGDGTTVDDGASLLGYTVEKGALVIGPVSVGRHCFVGTNSVVSPNTVIEDGARLEDLSLLESGVRIPAGQTWAGSPPRRVFRTAKTPDLPPVRSLARRIAPTAVYIAVALLLPLIELFAFLPGVAILTHLSPARISFYLAAPLIGGSFILCLTTLIVLLKWLLIGRARAGKYPVHGSVYVRNWVVEKLLALGVDVAGPLHATLFLKPWYRALGARLGRFAEVSTASITTPDLLDIGEDCFIADEVSLGAARVESGWLTLAPTKLNRRVFVGNSAVIPAGTTLADESLIGVLTIAPPEGSRTAGRGPSWLGSPPIYLPCRQRGEAFPLERTFRPSRKLQWARGCCEIFRVTLPGAAFIIVTVAVVEAALKLWSGLGPAATLALPAIFAACCIAMMGAVVAAKWIVMGRYKPFEQPFWSTFVWRWELVNALFEFLAAPIGMEALRGTPLLPWYLRMFGAKIGSGVYIDTIGFLEFDLVEIGDRTILNKNCILQTHLFEDRVLKASRLRVGADCEIGEHSIVLYGTQIGDRARLGALSLLMKGEVLPPGNGVWVGSPLSGAASGRTPTCTEPR